MSDLDFLDGLERDLVGAARRRRDARRAALLARLRQRLGLRHTGLAALLVVLVGAATAGATFAVLRASVISGPAARDTPRDQLPLPASATVSELRASDPDPAAPPWTLRLARSSTGLLCTTTGQVDDGRFGLVGLDGRFRVYAPDVVDSCGARPPGAHAPLVGARVFDADRHADVRTVVNGVGGALLLSATVIAHGRSSELPIGDGGTFVAALRGYPEDSALELVLRFDGGAVERHGFGRSEWAVLDPDGGAAWRASGMVGAGGRNVTCISFSPARGWWSPPRSPAVCGARTARGGVRDDYFFALRRIEPGPRRRPFTSLIDPAGDWRDHPPRTALWGEAGRDVARLEIDGGPDGRTTVTPTVGRTVLAVFGPEVHPAALTVRVVFTDGRVETRRGDTNLIEAR